VHDEGVQIVENLANIRVPVIAALEGASAADLVKTIQAKSQRVAEKGAVA
jgi:enoyl-CoA hydratase/carnithine racemase